MVFLLFFVNNHVILQLLRGMNVMRMVLSAGLKWNKNKMNRHSIILKSAAKGPSPLTTCSRRPAAWRLLRVRLVLVVMLSALAVLPALAQKKQTPKQDSDGKNAEAVVAKKDTAVNHFLEVGTQLDIFSNVFRNLDLFYVDTLSPSTTITSAIDGMLRSLDPYTDYYPASESKDLQMMLQGKYAGIGAMVKYHLVRNNVVIDEPYEDMPAAEAGLRKGDVVVAIDDSLMAGKPVNYVSSRLRGDAGTSFALRVLRPEPGKKGGKEMTFNITRRNIKLPSLPYYGLTGERGEGTEQSPVVGYIVLNQFTEGCAREVRNAFIDLKKRGATAMVLDLRANGGGSEMEAVDLVSIFVPKGQLVVENRGKVRQASRRYETRLEPVDTLMPLAVLVSNETASASEITAGALQDLDRAIIIGTRTYGKGLVQIPLDMPYNSVLKVTTSKYYIPSGRCIQAINYKKGREESGERSEGTRYAERTPDSLTHVFHTRNGREVRDGGGIKPDVEVTNDTVPNIAYYLSASGLDSTEVMFDYVTDYIARHPVIESPRRFHLSETDWQQFKSRVIESGFKYDLVSRKLFDNLVRAARQEGYYDDAREQFEQLSEKLRHNVAANLEKHREAIQQMIELDIIAAYYYQRGTIEAGLRTDKQLARACELLSDPAAMRKILNP